MAKIALLDEVIGWYGAVAVVIAYGLVSFQAIEASGMLFQALNVTGALGIIWISYKKRVYQSVALNIFWALIGAAAILRLLILR